MACHRGALDLLAAYDGDTSDDEVPGAKVSTKRTHKSSDEEESVERSRKKLMNRLPVPDIIINKTYHTEEHNDNPGLHGGRQRSFAHERGNWVSYIYIPFDMSSGIEELISEIKGLVLDADLQVAEHFHISVTKTFILRHHWIQSFIQSVRDKFSVINRFMIMFDSLRVFCNEERTRTFLGLQIKTGYDTLCNIVKVLDCCLDDFRLPNFYKDPSFHMSILWCVGDKEKELSSMLPQLNTLYNNVVSNTAQDNWFIYVTHLECKSGNKLCTFQLL